MLGGIITLILVFIGSTSASLYILYTYYKEKTNEQFSVKRISCKKLRDFFKWLEENEHSIYTTLVFYTIYVFVLIGLIIVFQFI